MRGAAVGVEDVRGEWLVGWGANANMVLKHHSCRQIQADWCIFRGLGQEFPAQH